MFLQGLVAQMNMMLIQAFRIKLQKGLLLSDSSQFISLKKQSILTGKSLHKADICMPFCQILYQHGDFLIILPIELFHYIIWDFSRHFHNLLGVSFLNIL